MHLVEIHYTNVKGKGPVAQGAIGSQMFGSWLYIDGEPAVENTGADDVSWAIRGGTPGGFIFLELTDPPPELRERFKPKDILSEVNGEEVPQNALWLPVRVVRFVQVKHPE